MPYQITGTTPNWRTLPDRTIDVPAGTVSWPPPGWNQGSQVVVAPSGMGDFSLPSFPAMLFIGAILYFAWHQATPKQKRHVKAHYRLGRMKAKRGYATAKKHASAAKTGYQAYRESLKGA